MARCPRRGYGTALRAGFAEARGTWILMGDADLCYDFGDLPRFWEETCRGCELVMGSRKRGTIEPGAMPRLHQHLGNPVLSSLSRALFRVGVSEAHAVCARSPAPRSSAWT